MSSYVFIDWRVPDYETLLAGLAPDVRVILLDATQDGIAQIAAALEGVTGLDTIHIISHGSEGTLYLGDSVINSDNLFNNASELATIGAALTSAGDMLLYGCEVANGITGQSFIENLARYTGADVAASTDTTGSEALNGDWVLESATGQVESYVLPLDGYTYMLAATPPPTQLSALNGTNGFRMTGEGAYDRAGFAVSGAGDVNGDGFDDVIVGAYRASAPGPYTGASYVVFGSASGFASSFGLGTLNGTNGFQLSGGGSYDHSGYSVSNAGDINGDGFDDVIVSAHTADPNGNASGASYVVFGKAGGFSADTSLATLNGSNGFRLAGVAASDYSGRSVSAAGDINGDGFDDLIIGADGADPYSQQLYGNAANAGSSYVVFGKASGFGSTVNLSSLNGVAGFRIDGVAVNDNSGRSVSGAGDINGDGYDDLIVGASNADPTALGAGSSYVIFGKASGFFSNIYLSSLNGTTGFRLDGVAQSDFSGFSVSGAGDVNGDGFDDLIVGAWFADPNGINSSGASYVVFGKASGFAATINLSTLNGVTGFRLTGAAADDLSGRSVSAAGDVNGDGFDDLIIGASSADPNGASSGAAYVMFGKASGFGSSISLSTLTGTSGFMLAGAAASNNAGISVSSAGDMNGDGFDDLIVGASGYNLGYYGARGASYVVFGGDFTGTVTHLGTSAANTLSGTAAADVMVAAQGNDTLTGNGGADVFRAGSGDDRIQVSTTAFANVDGGSGTDTLALTGGGMTLDLTALANNKISGIEIIDLAGSGNNTLTLSMLDLLDLSDSSNTLQIDGNAGDLVTLKGMTLAITSIPSGGYQDYIHGNVVLRVDTDISVKRDALPLDDLVVFRVDGAAANDLAGRAVSGAGDVNNDGYDDLIIGAPGADPGGRSGAGASYVIFGTLNGFSGSLNVSALNSTSGFRLDGAIAGDYSGRTVSSAGDINGDGFDDFIVGASGADPNGNGSGASYVVFGSGSGFGTSLNLSALTAPAGFKISGGGAYNESGFSVSEAGDINGDGFDDLIVGAPGYLQGGYGGSRGTSYVIFGKGTFPSTIVLSALASSDGFRITGENSYDSAGVSVSGAGDVNGDGFDDLFVGAWHASIYGYSTGASYVVFGKAAGFGSSVSLASLNGANGFQLNGGASQDLVGFSVSNAGDVNGDGFDDMIVGAYAADPNGSRSGVTYVVFGKANGFASDTNLSTQLNGANGFKIAGVAAYDTSGISVSGAGDVNGDGYDDLLVGAPGVDLNGGSAGATYLVFGKASGFSSVLNLSSLNGTNGFQIAGVNASDGAGYSVSAAGDLNGDGFDDIIIGAHNADPNGNSSAGSSYVVFGSNFTGAVTHLGTSGADSLNGTAGTDTMVAAQGNDTLTGNGGADVFRAGAGNDRIQVSTNTFANVDGGSGTDTLALTGGGMTLDLTALANNKISGIEVIDLTGSGNNTLTLSKLDLLDLSDSSNTLRVDGNVGDVVNKGSGWTDLGISGSYQRYAQGSAVLEVARAIANNAPGGANATVTTTEDTTLAFGAGNFGFTDPDAGDTMLGVRIDSLPAAGTMRLSGVPIVASQIISIGNIGNLTYLPAQDGNGTSYASFNFSVQDSFGTFDLSPNSISVNVAPVNDAPIVANPIGNKSVPLLQGFSFVVPGTDNPQDINDLFAFRDVDDAYDSITYSASLGAAASWLSFNSQTRFLSGTPTTQFGVAEGDVYSIGITASDGEANVTATFTLTITPAGLNLIAQGPSPRQGTSGNDSFVAAAGADTMIGGLGDDIYNVNDPLDAVTEAAGGGTDSVYSTISETLDPNVEDLFLGDIGGSINGTGNLENNHIYGNASDNLIDGGQGIDILFGGLGNDTYIVDNVNDQVIEAASAGTDSVEATSDVAGVTFSISANVEKLTLKESPTGRHGYHAQGNGDPNTLTGNSGNNNLLGLGGNDTLIGGAGNDTLDGGPGADSMTGGTGDDLYYVDDPGDQVIELANEGTDTVQSSITWTLTGSQGANVENLILAGSTNINGTGNTDANIITGNSGNNSLDAGGGTAGDSLDGGAGNDILTGAGGNDTLKGGTGVDVMAGGAGNDLYYVDTAADSVTDSGGNADQVVIGINFTAEPQVFQLYAGIERVTVFDVNAFVLVTGNDLDNIFVGANGNDSLDGALGNDSLTGGLGNDTLNGGSGVDTMEGGGGRDTYYVDNLNDRVVEISNPAGPITLIALFEDLIDTINASISYSLSNVNITGDVENLTLTGTATTGSGNELPNTITGEEVDNTLSGLDNNDTLIGGLGNDTLDGGAGTDVAVYAGNLADYQISTVNGTTTVTDLNTADGDEGSDTLTNIETLRFANLDTTVGNSDPLHGGAGDDHLTGGAGADIMTGGAGNDTLDGGPGADQLFGGIGNDTYYVDGQADIVFENAGEGTDTVISTTSFYLYDNIENLTLAAGTGNTFGSANAQNNILTGNEGNNLLLGWDGNDTIYGGAGNDVIYGVNNDDVLNGDAGIDVLIAGEGNDTLDGGADPDEMYGENGDDRLYGGTGFVTDILVAGAGNDTLDGSASIASGQPRNAGDFDFLYGGTGDDTYFVDTPSDLTFEFNGNTEGIDTVIADISGAGVYLYDNVENLTLTGSTVYGVGNGQDNQITGNAIGTFLLGGAGNDTINGKAGNDVLFGEAGADTFVFERGTGGDVIGDFQVGIDKIKLVGIGYNSFAQVQAGMSEVGGTTAIDLGVGDFIVINGVAKADLHAGDFLFA